MESLVRHEGNGLVFTILVNSEDEKEIHEWTEKLKQTIKDVFMEHGPVRVLTDLTKVTFTHSFGIRKKVAEMQKENSNYVRKSAAYTPETAIRWLANLIAKWSGRGNFEVFKSKEEALAWLNTIDREQVFRETIHEVYHHVKKFPDKDEIDALNHVREIYSYADSEGSELVLQFFNLQQGLVYVTFHHAKRNPDKNEMELLEDIEKNYTTLLNKYYMKEHEGQK